jgi:hypothetical protein
LAFCDRCHKVVGSSSFEDIGEEKRGKKFWWCKMCKFEARRCVVCRLGVKGLWMGCEKCRHGGHEDCMRVYHCKSTGGPCFSESPPTSIQEVWGIADTATVNNLRVSNSHSEYNAASAFSNNATSAFSNRDRSAFEDRDRDRDSTRYIAGTKEKDKDKDRDRDNQSILPPNSSQVSVSVDSAPRTSGETLRSTNDGEAGKTGHGYGWSACPSGCGCRCRVVAVGEGEGDIGTGVHL